MSKRKLLLADDSITIQKVVNLTFADEGIEVISVGDGDSAMRKFDDFIPDLVMADVNMPGLSGYEMCQIIKNNEETQNIPVILLVGSFEPFDEEEARRVGADDYLTKPFQSIRQLVNKVTDLLNRETNGASEAAPEQSAAAAGASPFETAADEESFSASAAPISFAEANYNEPAATERPTVDAFAETWRMPEQPASDYRADFGDAGMDDEMIETTRGADYEEASPNEYRSGTETPEDYAQTQPLSSEDVRQFNFTPERAGDELPAETAAEAAEMAAEAPENYAETPADDETAQYYVPEENAAEPHDAYFRDANAPDYAAPAFEEEAHPNDLVEQSYAEAGREPQDVYSSPESAADQESRSVPEDAAAAEPAPFYHSSEEETNETQDAQAEYQADALYDYQRFSQGEPETTPSPAEDTPAAGDETSFAGETGAPEAVVAETPAAETPAAPETFESARLESAPETAPETEAVSEESRPEAFEEVQPAAETAPPASFAEAAPAQTPAEASREELRQSEIPTAERIPVVSFDDDDMLELPPLVEETGIRPAPKAEPEPVEAKEETPPPPPAPTLSPEIIEAIAQRVAEKISGQAIQQIASQLAPQVSDLIVQELAREQEEKK